ncbi:alpha/beta hydrolase [Pseudoalteromonas xiamenensis]|uniref:alpha/beta hydrolase n=1 Tax=Pseudoalteromonas xiamenensis TaxID=882626 RepID=UPI0027E523FD|nr:alpha/beta fold hydrolase [Pseudoalteromonas xiamenensis]WMN58501.1 alpha/beta hydrolase [Pseudoalteromonas xiamenensis]
MLPFVEASAKGEHRATVIWLHGLGDSGHGFLPVANALQLPESLGVRFIFPHAPERPMTINGGMRMASWYDIKSLDLDKRADEQGVRESAEQVQVLIEQEIASGIAPDRIVLAGFSQGGVVTLHLAPRLPYALAGVMALSTYMCVPVKLNEEKQQASLNIFMAHGQKDNVVPLFAGELARDTLITSGYAPSWTTYAMAHEVCYDELADIRNWLIATLG